MNTELIQTKLIEGTASIEVTGEGEKYFLHIEGSYFGEFSTYTDALLYAITYINDLM